LTLQKHSIKKVSNAILNKLGKFKCHN